MTGSTPSVLTILGMAMDSPYGRGQKKSGVNCQVWVSNSTKWQKGRSRMKNDIQGEHQSKALIKGCCERTKAQGCVSSQGKVNTDGNLARATAKSRARCRQS